MMKTIRRASVRSRIRAFLGRNCMRGVHCGTCVGCYTCNPR